MDAARKKQSELDQLRTRLEEEHRRQMADLERQGREAVDRIRREVEEEARNARLDRVRAAADAMKADLRTKRGAADAALASQLARETPRPDEALPALHSLRGQFLVLSTAMAGVVDPDVREVLEKDADWVATVDVRDPIRLIDDRILTVRCRDAWAGWVVERDVDASLAAIEALGREFPAEAEPQILRALLLLRAGRPTEAEPALRALRERLPDEIRLNLALAEICVAAGRSDDAQPFLERAGLAKPRPADYYYVRGLWLLAQKKIEDALVEFEIGLRQGRGSPDLAVGRARCLLALDRAKEAEDVLDGFVRTLRRGDRSAWRSWVGQSPGRRWTAYETFLLYARSCLALGDRAEARRSAEEALRERPDDEAARQLLKEIGP
jgi:tetratricopeptide (TPR) repeat protein